MSHRPERPHADYSVPSVERAIRVLNHLRDVGPEERRSVAELCRALELPRTSAINILRTLEKHGYLHCDPESGKYGLGWALIGLGARASESNHREEELLHPLLVQLQKATGVSAVLGRVIGDNVAVVDKSEGSRQGRITISLGQVDPLNAGAPGKVFLAYDSELSTAEYLARLGLPAFTAFSITDIGAYHAELAKVRRNGYATDQQEYMLGLHAVAAPVFNVRSEVMLCVFMVDLAAALPAERFPELGQEVRRIAQRMTDALGGLWPPLTT